MRHLLAKKLILGSALLSLDVLWSPAIAFCQVILTGNVLDTASQAVAGASILLVSDSPGSSLDAQSSQAGDFRFVMERPGRYFVSVTAPGFFEVQRQPLDLVSGLNLATIIELVPRAGPDSSLEVNAGKIPVVESIPFYGAEPRKLVMRLHLLGKNP
jgi:hypothetical protein